MKFDVVNTENAKVSDIELEDSVFGAHVREHLFWEVVKMQLANRRRGTHKTKTVSEVRGSGKKPYKQKGTGRARHGSTRAMNMRGGGIVHGPRPRDYSYKLPRKMVRAAVRSALSLRASEAKLHIIKDWAPESPGTKAAAQVLKNFDAAKALVVGLADNQNLGLSIRNLATAKFLPLEAINVYDILKYDHLFITEDAVAGIHERFQTEPSRSEQALQHQQEAAV